MKPKQISAMQKRNLETITDISLRGLYELITGIDTAEMKITPQECLNTIKKVYLSLQHSNDVALAGVRILCKERDKLSQKDMFVG